jgi:DNA-binding IclR family transcriptional regulator
VQLGSDYVASVDPVREFYEVCRSAPADLGALIQLSVLDDGINAVFLAREDLNSGLRLGLTAEIGRRVPAYFTAAGKALLAALDDGELEARLARAGPVAKGATPRSAATLEEVRATIARTRDEGFGRDDEETVPGIECIGVAVPTTQREADHFAISFSAPKGAADGKRSKVLQATLAALASSLRDRL